MEGVCFNIAYLGMVLLGWAAFSLPGSPKWLKLGILVLVPLGALGVGTLVLVLTVRFMHRGMDRLF